MSPPIIDARLLDVLLQANGPVTVQALAARLDLPLSKVGRELERLREAGCELDTHPQHGVTLVRSGLGAWVDYLQFRLGDERVVECYRRTGSTQDAARRLVTARPEAADRAVIVADEQTAGRGRLGRAWIAPPGTAVLFSRVVGERSGVDRITFAASVGLCWALESLLGDSGVEVAIKWPNDVQLGGLKVAGILVESVETPLGRQAILGVGINTHVEPRHLPPELGRRMTSLAMLGRPVDRLRVLAEVLLGLDRALAEPEDRLLGEWRARCTMLRRRMSLRHDGRDVTGEVIDLDPDDGLIVRRDSGEIVHLPAATTTVIR